MGLKVDVQFGQIAVSDLYLRLHNVSGTKDVAFYSITLFDAKAGAEVPLLPIDDRYFTFGEPKNKDLPTFDVSANPWSQCYEDFKARFAKGLLPWVKGLREEAGTTIAREAERIVPPQAPTLTLVPETSPEPEADDFTQAEEVKPDDETSEEGEAAASEIYDLETEVEAPETEPLTIDELVRSGTMLTEDEFAMRVGVLAGRIEQYAQQRIAARYDANARADILQNIQNYISKGALGIHTTPDEDESYARANEQNTWITAQEAHARQLREQLPSLTLEMLRAYRLEEAGWP